MAKLNKTQLQKAHKELKDDARKRIAERGVLQFRADADTVLAILDAADKANMPVGALLRQWVQEKLILEKAPDLIQRVTFLEDAVTELRRKVQ